MKEKPLPWPRVNIEKVDPNWWDEVMQTSSRFQQYFSRELDDSADFTIRGIIHLIVAESREDVAWFLEGSVQSERILTIYDKIHSDDDQKKKTGMDNLVSLIEDYTKDVLGQE